MPELCVLHANCQGEVLERLLGLSGEFSRRFGVRRYVNYTREPIPLADLERCRLFLYQKLGADFGPLASANLVAKLSPKAWALEIPNLFFKGYWPFWTQAPGVIEFADALLERLLAQGLPAPDIMRIYLSGAHPSFARVSEIAEASLAMEARKEEGQPIKTHGLLATYWREEALFFTVNHPGVRLSLHVADSLLHLLSFPPLSPSARASFVHPDADFELPVHPVVAKRLGLSFAGPGTRFRIFQSQLTHRDFVLAYLACRLNREEHLASFLRGRSEVQG